MGTRGTMPSPDNLLRVVAGLLLALLCWTGNKLVNRVERLEANQQRLMVRMGVEPIAHEKRGLWRASGTAFAKPMEPDTPKKTEISP